MHDEITVLAEPAIFKGLSQEQIRKLLNITHRVSFKKGDIIMKEGDIGHDMYIIHDGTVEVVKSLVLEGMDDDDAERGKVFTHLSADDHAVFGEIALLEESKRTATIRALTDCVFFEISKDEFLLLAEKDFELGYRVLLNLSRIVSARLRKADEDTIKLTTALSIILKEV
jgi:CRP/FNR family transcriptional regulator, cyclic AMP receptor protein